MKLNQSGLGNVDAKCAYFNKQRGNEAKLKRDHPHPLGTPISLPSASAAAALATREAARRHHLNSPLRPKNLRGSGNGEGDKTSKAIQELRRKMPSTRYWLLFLHVVLLECHLQHIEQEVL